MLSLKNKICRKDQFRSVLFPYSDNHSKFLKTIFKIENSLNINFHINVTQVLAEEFHNYEKLKK